MYREVPAGTKYGLIAVAAFVLAVYVYGLRLFQRFRFRNIPGPSPPWLVGEVATVMKVGQPKAFQTWRERYGPGLHKMQLASMSFLNVGKPETARKILYGGARPDLRKSEVRSNHTMKGRKSSILFTRGEEWKGLRATWQPMFYTGNLEKCIPIFDGAARLFVEELSWAAKDNNYMDVYTPLQDVTLSVICQAAFGLALHNQKADNTQLSKEDRDFAVGIAEAGKNLFLSPRGSLWIIAAQLFPFMLPAIRLFAERFPDKPLKNVADARKTLERASARILRDHRESLAAGKGDGKSPGSFIDLLVKTNDRATGEPLPDEGIVEQANNLSFTMYLLARPSSRNQQDKVIAEVDALGQDWVPTFDDLEEKLPYLDACLKEALRLYPPGHLHIRESESDMILEGYKVPKGTTFFISAYTIHRDPEVWGDSVADFQPERWLTTDPVAAKTAKNGFFGFGDGPRVCPGSRFAQLEAKTVLARTFQKYRLELQPGTEPLACKDGLTLSPKDGVFVRPVTRQRE